jgi:hypothetical protein
MPYLINQQPDDNYLSLLNNLYPALSVRMQCPAAPNGHPFNNREKQLNGTIQVSSAQCSMKSDLGLSELAPF